MGNRQPSAQWQRKVPKLKTSDSDSMPINTRPSTHPPTHLWRFAWC